MWQLAGKWCRCTHEQALAFWPAAFFPGGSYLRGLQNAVPLIFIGHLLRVQQDGPAVHPDLLRLIHSHQDTIGVLPTVASPPAEYPRQIISWKGTGDYIIELVTTTKRTGRFDL